MILKIIKEKLISDFPFSLVFSGLGSRNTNSRSPGMSNVFLSAITASFHVIIYYMYMCNICITFHFSQLLHPLSQLERVAQTDEDWVLTFITIYCMK